MSYTNQTQNLKLPQYVSSDHPTWIQDINGAFEKVDNFAGQVEQNQLTTNQKFQSNENRWSDNDAKLEEIQEVATQQGVEITANAEDIAKLQENVSKLNTDTTQQGEDIDTLKNNVETNTADITELEGKVDLNTQNINGINTKIDNFPDNPVDAYSEDYRKMQQLILASNATTVKLSPTLQIIGTTLYTSIIIEPELFDFADNNDGLYTIRFNSKYMKPVWWIDHSSSNDELLINGSFLVQFRITGGDMTIITNNIPEATNLNVSYTTGEQLEKGIVYLEHTNIMASSTATAFLTASQDLVNLDNYVVSITKT